MDRKIRIVFFGTPEFSASTLRALLESKEIEVAAVVTQPDRPAGRGGKLSMSAVKALAQKSGLKILQPEKIKKTEAAFLEELRGLGPIDLSVVIAFGQILPESVLNFPRAGSVNIHASILPRWRGAAPIQRAILAGDKESGVCLMKMNAGLDTGPVYIDARTEIAGTDTFLSLHDRLAELGAALLLKNAARIVSGELKPQPQPDEGVVYAAKILNDEARIDWSLSAEEIQRKIRALNPAPGAFTGLHGKRFKIYAASFHQTSPDPKTAPGTAINSARGRIEIQCGQGTIVPTDIQIEGKKRMSVDEFLRGATIPADTKFA